MEISFFCWFGNIFLMLVLYDKLKSPQRIMNIISQMTQMACQSPPKKVMKHLEGKENPVEILTIKVCVSVFYCYDILIFLLLI